MYKSIPEIIPAFRLLFSQERLLSVRFLPERIYKIIDSDKGKKEQNLIYSTDEFLELDKAQYTEEELKKIALDWKSSHTSYPKIVLLKNRGAFAFGENATSITDFINGESESNVPELKGRLSGKIAVVTGGAQGFGAGIAESLINEGANVVIADLNHRAGEKLVDDMNSKGLSNQAKFVSCDVSNASSVEKLVLETIQYFGGLDVMISNAGILRAGSLEEMTPETFELMTKVNYTGYFNCAKYASELMKNQSAFTDQHFFDIIQINSKSGLKGSNKNFAYAGGKFGGIGLTQSFALELMPFRTKVNSICPGNFFDGPLWSDPEKGLFVQYLNAGKVPGAKSIEDVKHFYEQQVPAGRGCGIRDVAKAIYYAIEQEYETGQAIPVTGGQIMLH